ncbi:hypothetical protein [Sanguibacter sp. 25GB23B1]|uniref:hypothetical protein n=1 Tax=unclassified Sanguibacter TaxID=2645534 RepID=UPI0032AEBBFC
MTKMSILTLVVAGSIVFVLAGCSADQIGDPETGSTVAMTGDYIAYDERSLVEDATLVVEGTPMSFESRMIAPQFEGDTPEENPLLGLSEEEKEKAIAEASGVPVTVVTFRVDVVHKGDVQPGEEITINQIGGAINGVTYVQADEVMLEAKQNYLLFATDDLDGAYAILGGSAGMYVDAGDSTFAAAKPEMAPFETLTGPEVGTLTQ